TIYTATYQKIWVTRNGGVSWEEITAGLPQQAIMSIEVAPNNPEKVWVAMSGFSDNEKVYRSADGGKTWENFSTGLPNIPCNVIVYKKESDDALYLGADIGVYYRDNTMDAWQPFITGLPNVIINDLEIQYPWNRLIAGSYGRGLWATDLYVPQNEDWAYIHTPVRYSCLNDSVEFSITVNGQPDSIVWNFNGESSESTSSAGRVKTTFSTPGMKDVSAVVYYQDHEYNVDLNNYVSIVASPELSVVAYGASSFHRGDDVSLLAFGADSYSWEPSSSLTSPDASMTLASPTTTTTYTVTGMLGNCQASDTVTINVLPGPVNDDVCSATTLEQGMNGPFTNVNASVQSGEPFPDTTNCNTQITWCSEGGLQNSVWFSYKAVSSSSSFVTSGFDTQIALYEADACNGLLNGQYTLIAANDDYFGASKKYAAAIEEAPLKPGVRYWIQVDGSGGGEEGTFYINIYDAPVGIAENDMVNHDKVSIFPNPGKDEFNLEINGLDGTITMKVFNITGELIMQKSFDNVQGYLKETFNIGHPGVYIVRVSNGTDQVTRQLIAQ
ncbi:MAG TPA: T9SS type A sorting domain-containing protein, partial [Bacteroidales bacterium]|nr:T9SS type A sorting domain-containing protein [Bacteroidales bacterium]